MGKITPGDALGFGTVLAVGSVTVMGLAVNYAAAGLLAVSILFYVFIYTVWLKRRTPQNIVIGGAAGAFPPMIGWAAVTGSVGIESALLFALIFFWFLASKLLGGESLVQGAVLGSWLLGCQAPQFCVIFRTPCGEGRGKRRKGGI